MSYSFNRSIHHPVYMCTLQVWQMKEEDLQCINKEDEPANKNSQQLYNATIRKRRTDKTTLKLSQKWHSIYNGGILLEGVMKLLAIRSPLQYQIKRTAKNQSYGYSNCSLHIKKKTFDSLRIKSTFGDISRLSATQQVQTASNHELTQCGNRRGNQPWRP